MFDVFTEQIEVLIKDGISNLYWFKGDLHKAWLRVGVAEQLARRISRERLPDGTVLSKRKQMDRLYEEIRNGDFNRRLEISRNFVRILIEHTNFVPQDPKHRIEVAERAALKLREIVNTQRTERESSRVTTSAGKVKNDSVDSLQSIREAFEEALHFTPQQRGYALEKIFVRLMKASAIEVHEPFKCAGEQLDGAIKFEGFYYLIEVKWFAEKLEPKHIGSFHFKVEGKLGARGIMIAMNGYTSSVVESISKGKELRILLLDGNHLANVIYGMYGFDDLLNHSIKCASLFGQLYCSHSLARARRP